MRVAAGPFIKAIAGINLLVAAIMLIPALWEPVMVAGALFPARFTAGDAAFQGYFVLPVWLTPVTSAFLHGGILHVGLNMLMLLMIGPNLERVLGWRSVAVLYGAGIILSAVAEVIAKPSGMVPIVGASGAISALIAAHAMLFPREVPKAIGPIPGRWAHALKLLIGWTILNLMLGFVGPSLGVTLAVWAHVGGFVAGLLLTWPLLHWKYRQA
ncbi:rhomboid family intramembrane serine protease [Sphingorhabdus sp.]|jgi:membrane associated rhomboid family serine protease|uniref:rhomboid family intramembrane serine protease n=1 Tax=Sphingorhabdus sp. TaxID=1902408 RepID=UPI003BAF0CD6|nr:rhomboid family intramembrane serine protease [Sphingomonadales bacterium]MBL0022955.1 rhomboid family intramembrane serine protease [Sphingomonadales bacterium]